jgi:hypothetical protein
MADDLVISVGASIKALERQMKAAGDLAEKRADEIENEFKRRNPSFSGDFGLGVLKGAIAAISFERITSGFIEANKEIASFGDSARRAGLDLVKFQELRLAAAGEGISGKTFDAGIDGLAKKLNEARTEEGELGKLFEANNVKLKSRTGEIITTNEALLVAADLISRAATEQDKILIAEKFGIPKDFVPLLEGGAKALEELARKAGEAGAILDSDVIAKAKDFDTAWNNAWASFASNSKAAIISASQGLSGLLSQASAYLKSVNEANAAQSQSADRAARRDQARQMALGNAGGRAAVDAAQAAADRELRARFVSSEKDRSVTAPLPATRPGRGVIETGKPTIIPPKGGGGGGGGGGKAEDEQAQARLDRYIETLMRQNSVLDAEIATFGKSNAEKRAAIELAKAQVDLAKLDEASRQTVIASLTKEIELSEQKRTKLAELKSAQQGLNDAQKFFGNAAVDALEDMIFNGAKAEDVIKNLTKSLAQAGLKALLLGEGPLAGLFGTKGSEGSAGGIFGALLKGATLFGRATGGNVNAGQAYRVGERGPETFVPTSPGRIVPASTRSGSTYAPVFQIDARGADAGAVARIEASLKEQARSFNTRVAGANRVGSVRSVRPY